MLRLLLETLLSQIKRYHLSTRILDEYTCGMIQSKQLTSK